MGDDQGGEEGDVGQPWMCVWAAGSGCRLVVPPPPLLLLLLCSLQSGVPAGRQCTGSTSEEEEEESEPSLESGAAGPCRTRVQSVVSRPVGHPVGSKPPVSMAVRWRRPPAFL